MLNLDELIDLGDDDDLEISQDSANPEDTNDDPIDPATGDDLQDPEPDPNSEPGSVGEDVDEEAVAYYQYLVDNEVISVPEDFEFDGTTEGINKALDITREKQINSAREEL